LGQDFSPSPNRDVIGKVKEDAQLALEQMQSHIDARRRRSPWRGGCARAVTVCARGSCTHFKSRDIGPSSTKMKRSEPRALSVRRLEQRYSDLKAKEKILTDAKATLETLYKERDSFRAQLSNLRDQRYRLRVGVADRLNEKLKPISASK